MAPGKKFNADYYATKASGKIKINVMSKSLFYALEMTRLYQTIQEKETTKFQFNRLKNNINKQNNIAMELFKKLNYKEGRNYGIDCLDEIQNYYDRTYPGMYRIIAFDELKGLKPIWKAEGQRKYEVCLLKDGSHWDGLKKISYYWTIRKKYCVDCETTYDDKIEHTLDCVARCRKCCRIGYGFPCKTEENVYYCTKCDREFYNKDCFENHMSRVCNRYHRCVICNFEYNTKFEHICGEKMCQKCYVYHNPERSCYIKKFKIPKKAKEYIIMAYDFECLKKPGQEKYEGKFEHNVNFVSARYTCTRCEGKIQDCEICGDKDVPRHMKWCSNDGIDPLKEFIDYCCSFEKYTVIAYAHYAGRYDSHFVLREISRRENLACKITIGENRIYQLSVKQQNGPKILFRDTWLLMQVRLADLTKTFDLNIPSKLYFPHNFNKEENYGKQLEHLPPFEDYCPESMMPNDYEKFKIWYEQNKNTPFLLEEKLDEYCSNDTEILMEATLKFRKCLLEVTKDEETPNGIDILWDATTIAGACVRIYRAKYLKEKHLPIVPERGYERNDRQSTIALKYFDWIAKTENTEVKHAGNGKEEKITIKHTEHGREKIKNFKLDCWIPSQKKIIEFNGCAFHGCPTCYRPTHMGPNGKTAEQNFFETKKRTKLIKKYAEDKNIEFEIIWECEVREYLKRDKEMKEFFAETPDRGPIDPRNAYFGGRTAPSCLYAEANEELAIGMADVVSLYPSINYIAKYPVGIPNIIRPKPNEIEVNWTKADDIKYNGLLKVRVIPPKNLMYPVLPVHIEEMMLFPLCIKCVKKRNEGFTFIKDIDKCQHTDEERSFTQEYTSEELKEALRMGYRIDRFYRAYDYENFDDDLFKPYVKKFLKIKVEASGFPENVKTDEEKKKFVERYKEIYGIEIDLDNVKKNPGMRHIAKLALNSLWGKFSMRNTLKKNELIRSNDERYLEIYFDHKIVLKDKIKINEEAVRIVYKDKDDFIEEHDCSNIVVSLWTTSLARLKLYEYMKMVFESHGCKILYTDTDSIIYLYPRGKDPLKTGDLLGEMSKEYSDCDILEYVSAGPKQYSLKLRNKSDGKIWHKTKIRGITLDEKNKMDYYVFKDMIVNYDPEKKVVFEYNEKFGPTSDAFIVSKPVTKIYKPVNNKGWIDDEMNVIPFGYSSI